MNEAKAILAIVAGSAAIVFGFTTKQFYAGPYGAGLGRPVARWKGRLLFVFVGAVMLLIGFKVLFFDVSK